MTTRRAQSTLMTRRPAKNRGTGSSGEEAMKIALGIQRPGQTKEQTKLIARGIQKGIELYKRERSAKDRELDRKLRAMSRQDAQEAEPAADPEPQPGGREATPRELGRIAWLPWLLLAMSWAGIGAYVLTR